MKWGGSSSSSSITTAAAQQLLDQLSNPDWGQMSDGTDNLAAVKDGTAYGGFTLNGSAVDAVNYSVTHALQQLRSSRSCCSLADLTPTARDAGAAALADSQFSYVCRQGELQPIMLQLLQTIPEIQFPYELGSQQCIPQLYNSLEKQTLILISMPGASLPADSPQQQQQQQKKRRLKSTAEAAASQSLQARGTQAHMDPVAACTAAFSIGNQPPPGETLAYWLFVSPVVLADQKLTEKLLEALGPGAADLSSFYGNSTFPAASTAGAKHGSWLSEQHMLKLMEDLPELLKDHVLLLQQAAGQCMLVPVGWLHWVINVRPCLKIACEIMPLYQLPAAAAVHRFIRSRFNGLPKEYTGKAATILDSFNLV